MGQPDFVSHLCHPFVGGVGEGFITNVGFDVGWEIFYPHSERHLLAALGLQRSCTLAEIIDDLFG